MDKKQTQQSMDETSRNLILFDIERGLSKSRIVERHKISFRTLNKIMEDERDKYRDAFKDFKLTKMKFLNRDMESRVNGEDSHERFDALREIILEVTGKSELDEHTNKMRVWAVMRAINNPKTPIPEIIDYFAFHKKDIEIGKTFDKRKRSQIASVRKLNKIQKIKKSEVVGIQGITSEQLRFDVPSLRQSFRKRGSIPIYTTKTIHRKRRDRGVMSKLGSLRLQLNRLNKKLDNAKTYLEELYLKDKINQITLRIKNIVNLDKDGRYKKFLANWKQLKL